MNMMARTDTSVVGRWWWTVDRWLLAAVVTLVAMGTILGFAASPAVAEHIGAVSPYHFVTRHIIFLIPALMIMWLTSLLSPVNVRRLACLVFVGGLVLMVGAIMFGPAIKGATRWLYIGPFSIQPSEFVKPAFCVVAAWMFSEAKRSADFPGYSMSLFFYAITVSLLIAQPDMGMTVVLTAVWCAQFFLAGMPVTLIAGVVVVGLVGALSAYTLLPHVAHRVNLFLDPQSGDTFQIDKALSAFKAGGVTGVGPGNGNVKLHLPDAHTDFIFAVAGEEFGLFACVFIVSLFAFVVLRSLVRLLEERDFFVMLSVGGLITQFGLQALINMGVNVHLLPTKGMTLPFISYGGSSLCALALGMGMILALTRRDQVSPVRSNLSVPAFATATSHSVGGIHTIGGRRI